MNSKEGNHPPAEEQPPEIVSSITSPFGVQTNIDMKNQAIKDVNKKDASQIVFSRSTYQSRVASQIGSQEDSRDVDLQPQASS